MGIWVKTQKGARIEINGYDFCRPESYYEKFMIIGFDTRNPNDDQYFELGKYNSFEKTEKVLDMLQDKIIEIDKTRFYRAENANYVECVFKMPQDDEVENNENSK